MYAIRSYYERNAGGGIMRTAKTWALMCGRNHVVPEDVQTILPSVVEHRLV